MLGKQAVLAWDERLMSLIIEVRRHFCFCLMNPTEETRRHSIRAEERATFWAKLKFYEVRLSRRVKEHFFHISKIYGQYSAYPLNELSCPIFLNGCIKKYHMTTTPSAQFMPTWICNNVTLGAEQLTRGVSKIDSKWCELWFVLCVIFIEARGRSNLGTQLE